MTRHEDSLREQVVEQMRSSGRGREIEPALTVSNGALSEAERVRAFLGGLDGGVVVDRYMAQVSESYD